MDTITKRKARELLDTNDAGLARFFDVTPAAISQWEDDEPIPSGRVWQARAQRPDLFPMPITAEPRSEAA